MLYDDFEDTPQFDRLFRNYQNRVSGIVYPEIAPKGKSSAGGASASTSAGANIRDRLGLPPKRD